jgi:hypothetical protein
MTCAAAAALLPPLLREMPPSAMSILCCLLITHQPLLLLLVLLLSSPELMCLLIFLLPLPPSGVAWCRVMLLRVLRPVLRRGWPLLASWSGCTTRWVCVCGVWRVFKGALAWSCVPLQHMGALEVWAVKLLHCAHVWMSSPLP